MKPMIGKSIDQSMTIDALLVNWHRLASANRWPIDNHTKVVTTHRLSSIGVEKISVSHMFQPVRIHTRSTHKNVWHLNSFTGLFVCCCMVSKINNRNTLWNSVLKKRKSTTHLFALLFLSLSFILLISGWYEFLGILYLHYFLFFQQVLSTRHARWNYYYLIYPCKISENN